MMSLNIHAETLLMAAEIISRIDGDNAPDKPSDLTCEATMAVADLMRSVAHNLACSQIAAE